MLKRRKPESESGLAAVDLGSNSFHMVIGRVIGEQVSLIDRLREPVRLAAGLRDDGSLEDETVERALGCLERFAERLRGVPRERKRVVGTNTLRRARRGGEFLARARAILGVPVEILPGPEEARLVYLGVSHDVAFGQGQRLVIDIGGGSTEVIVGEGFEPRIMDSLHMGCVSWSSRFFKRDKITRDAFRAAELAARQELETVERKVREAGWKDCIGSSGTIKAVREIVRESGWSEAWIDRPAAKALRKRMIEAGTVDALDLPGLERERAPVLAGGLAILRAVIDTFAVETMRTSDYALREGILHDLIGRIGQHDVRDRTIAGLAKTYHVDGEQAKRVEVTALALFEQVAESWSLNDRARRYLTWAARVAEIGLAIAYSGYHKHGAYILANAALPGFSHEARALLAALILEHRRKLDREAFDALPPYNREIGVKLSVLLRLATTLNRRRGAASLPPVEALAGDEKLELRFPEGYLAENPLTSADLAAETAALLAVGFELSAA